MLNYFRRPKLAGANLPRLSAPTLRGNVRRHDADATMAEPYFVGVTNAQNLIVTSNIGTSTVAISGGPSMSAVLASLNAAGALELISVTAFDADGCLGLKTTASLGAFIRVDGGTAATALGFDVGAQRFVSYGGDIEGPSEGRRGTAYGTSFPNRGESLSVDGFNRALGRVAGNMDILHSDLVRQEVVVRKIGTYQVSPSASASYIDINNVASGQRIYAAGQPTGTPYLTAGSTLEELARFFFLIGANAGDSGTLSHSKVSGVTTTANSNILGVEQTIVSNATISTIVNSTTVRVDGVDFTTLGVTPNDYVRISGATNTTPFSNNGYRWAVEEVLDATHLVLRPLSASELALVGETADAAGRQPRLELNTAGPGYGTLTITRGPWAINARLQLTPALPHSSRVDVWAAVPVSPHDRRVHDLAVPALAVGLTGVEKGSVAPDGILTAPGAVTVGSNYLQTQPFTVRWNGRTVWIGVATITRYPTGTTYVYWNTSTCLVESANTLDLTNRQLVWTVLQNNTSTPVMRLIGTETHVATVGTGGHFSSLTQAVSWARYQYQANGAIFALVILDFNTTLSATITLDFPVTIRGKTAHCRIVRTGSFALFTLSGTLAVTLQDFIYDSNGALVAGTTSYLSVLNVGRLDGSDGTLASIFLNRLILSWNSTGGSIDGTIVSVGTATATQVNIGRTGQVTRLDGSVRFAGSIEGNVGALNIGTSSTQTTSLALGSATQTATVNGSIIALNGGTMVQLVSAWTELVGDGGEVHIGAATTAETHVEGEVISIDGGQVTVDSDGAINVGPTSATGIVVGRSGITTTVHGTLDAQTVDRPNGMLTIGGNATVVAVGRGAGSTNYMHGAWEFDYSAPPTIDATPATGLHAVNKNYVDAAIAGKFGTPTAGTGWVADPAEGPLATTYPGVVVLKGSFRASQSSPSTTVCTLPATGGGFVRPAGDRYFTARIDLAGSVPGDRYYNVGCAYEASSGHINVLGQHATPAVSTWTEYDIIIFDGVVLNIANS